MSTPVRNTTDVVGDQKPDQTMEDNANMTEATPETVIKQLNYYFSPENLSKDTYLTNNMDVDGYVPVSVISTFPMMKTLKASEEAILSAAKESDVVEADSTRRLVRLKRKEVRNTVIIRDVKPDVLEADILQLLVDYPQPKSIVKEASNWWYLTFGSDEEAANVLNGIRGKQLKDDVVRARIKISYSATTPVVPSSVAAGVYVPSTAEQAQNAYAASVTEMGGNPEQYPMFYNQYGYGGEQQRMYEGGDYQGRGRGFDRRRGGQRGGAQGPRRYTSYPRDPSRRGRGSAPSGYGFKGQTFGHRPPVKADATNFPPLPGTEDAMKGYTYRKYQEQEMLSIFSSLEQPLNRPEGLGAQDQATAQDAQDVPKPSADETKTSWEAKILLDVPENTLEVLKPVLSEDGTPLVERPRTDSVRSSSSKTKKSPRKSTKKPTLAEIAAKSAALPAPKPAPKPVPAPKVPEAQPVEAAAPAVEVPAPQAEAPVEPVETKSEEAETKTDAKKDDLSKPSFAEIIKKAGSPSPPSNGSAPDKKDRRKHNKNPKESVETF